jgi:hypothetical protein
VSVSPNIGLVAGGGTVRISGSGFTTANLLQFGLASTFFTVDSDTQITATIPMVFFPGVVDIRVTTEGGTATGINQFKYLPPAPVVSSASPSHEPLAGGIQVTIAGSYFTGATAVFFGAQQAKIEQVLDNAVIVVVPAGVVGGPVPIAVLTPTGSSNTDVTFTYDAPPPDVSSLSPPTGPMGGGNTVVVSGRYFTGATAVTFGSTSAGAFTVDSDSHITATAPAFNSGLPDVAVSVTTPSGRGTSTLAYHYTIPVQAPTIESLTPTSGSTRGGTPLVIRGDNFMGALSVNLGSIALTAGQFTVDSDTQITVPTPIIPDDLAAKLLVIVTTGAGPSNSVPFD